MGNDETGRDPIVERPRSNFGYLTGDLGLVEAFRFHMISLQRGVITCKVNIPAVLFRVGTMVVPVTCWRSPMPNVDDTLRRAADLSRLQAIIEMARRTRSLDQWASQDRVWFTQLLSPFAPESQAKSLLTTASQATCAPPVLDLVDELSHMYSDDIGAMRTEFEGILRLLIKLLGNEHLEESDVDQVERLASVLRRRLIRVDSFLHQPRRPLFD